ncbi:hypothetical protein [Endozoicomonas sp. SCSIO W0465]|uniref:hypothetical protein n=1 Tax=Endozoicomonas sp. SCSIO W0465 TaxID=2918516 RepID=UPI002075B86F|nr:hypothetical protein [Endozoicomonas sp. SCSIO W0465]USE38958.1 hypothetical protein MJO57_12790 [Endozoicomonas sp. SCSIO W0465]
MGRSGNRQKNRLFSYGNLPELPMRSRLTENGRQTDLLLVSANLEETLHDASQDAQRIDDRVRAIMSIRHLNHHRAVRLLREALKDPADDVRLLAYSILSHREKLIQQEIASLKSGLSHQHTHYQISLLKRLAQLHWQLVDQSLLHDNEARQLAADQACQFANSVLQQGHDPDMQLLLARYYLWQETPESARFHLLQPGNDGSSERNTRPSQFLHREWGQLFMALRQPEPVAQVPINFGLQSTSSEDASLEPADS